MPMDFESLAQKCGSRDTIRRKQTLGLEEPNCPGTPRPAPSHR